MRKIILIPVSVFVFFLMEFLLFNMAGRLFMPNLLLLLIIYFNLAFGIRYSIFAAVLAGLFKDSFAVGNFGLNMFAFVVCAYMTTILKKYIHYAGSRRSRLILVFSITTIHFVVILCLQSMFGSVHVGQAVKFVFVPEMLATLIVTSFIFTHLRKCVSKLFA